MQTEALPVNFVPSSLTQPQTATKQAEHRDIRPHPASGEQDGDTSERPLSVIRGGPAGRICYPGSPSLEVIGNQIMQSNHSLYVKIACGNIAVCYIYLVL